MIDSWAVQHCWALLSSVSTVFVQQTTCHSHSRRQKYAEETRKACGANTFNYNLLKFRLINLLIGVGRWRRSWEKASARRRLGQRRCRQISVRRQHHRQRRVAFWIQFGENCLVQGFVTWDKMFRSFKIFNQRQSMFLLTKKIEIWCLLLIEWSNSNFKFFELEKSSAFGVINCPSLT